MHHKRGKPKNSRSGCLMCKRQKVNGFNDRKLEGAQHYGFGRHVKREYLSDVDRREGLNG